MSYNNEIHRMYCPPTDLTKPQRVTFLSEQICDWVYSDAMCGLLKAFGGRPPKTKRLEEYVSWLNEFVEIWDFRKKQASGGERWKITDDPIVQSNADIIDKAAASFGMKSTDMPVNAPDFVLPLGGAFLANIARPAYARRVVDLFCDSYITIVALSGMRPLTEAEKAAIAQYCPLAQTEYDIISAGLANAFELNNAEYEEEYSWSENINLCWSIRAFADNYKGRRVFTVAAPSSDASRRANSLDTFNFFFHHFQVQSQMKLLLVTTSIYVPFQFMKFMPLAIENEIFVECVGTENVNPSSFNQASNYLQEIKGTVNAIKVFVDTYLGIGL